MRIEKISTIYGLPKEPHYRELFLSERERKCILHALQQTVPALPLESQPVAKAIINELSKVIVNKEATE